MGLIKGDQLRLIGKLFGFAPDPLAGLSDLDDNHVSLVVNANDLIRRGLTEANVGGWFFGILENVHSGADTEQSSIRPYFAGADANPPFPGLVPLGWDLWVAGVCGNRNSGAGGLTDAIMHIDPTNDDQMGFGRDDAGTPVAPTSPSIPLAHFNGLAEAVGGITQDPMINTVSGVIYQPTLMRLPRECSLIFSTTSAAAAEFQAQFLMGLFPEGLGQDIAS